MRQKGSNKVMTSLSYVRRDVTDGGGSEEARDGGEGVGDAKDDACISGGDVPGVDDEAAAVLTSTHGHAHRQQHHSPQSAVTVHEAHTKH